LAGAQEQADRALVLGRAARAELDAALAALGAATGAASAADARAGALEREARSVALLGTGTGTGSGGGAGGGVVGPDPVAVRSAVRSAQVAAARVGEARARVGDAASRLAAARRLALDAQGLREDGGRVAARAIEDAASVGIAPKSFWDQVTEVAAKAWDVLIVVAKVAVVVLGVVALVIGGPIAWVVLGAALLILADTLAKYARGEATWGDVAWSLVGCIPGTKGLTTLTALRTALRTGGTLAAGAHVLGAGRTAVAGMAASVLATGAAAAALGRGLPGALRQVRVLTATTPDGTTVPAGIDLSSLRVLMNQADDAGRSAGAGRPDSAPNSAVYESSPKHDQRRTGVGSQPSDGPGTLGRSVPTSPETTTRRVGVDPVNQEFVVFDETTQGRFHGHVRTWDQLTPAMRSALIKAGLATTKGKIIE
jgi:hypothetical protein